MEEFKLRVIIQTLKLKHLKSFSLGLKVLFFSFHFNAFLFNNISSIFFFFLHIIEISEKTGTTAVCDIKELVFTSDPNKNHAVLKDNHVQKGVSYIPFSIALPENLPSSIETSKNKIIYRLNGFIFFFFTFSY